MDNRELIEELFLTVPVERRCPHIRLDDIGPFCAKDIEEGKMVGIARRSVCDSASLQLWCLDKDRCEKCIWYQGEKFQEVFIPSYN